jgi:hypothetical protein
MPHPGNSAARNEFFSARNEFFLARGKFYFARNKIGDARNAGTDGDGKKKDERRAESDALGGAVGAQAA